jgi:hypothetical protein
MTKMTKMMKMEEMTETLMQRSRQLNCSVQRMPMRKRCLMKMMIDCSKLTTMRAKKVS